MQTGAKRPVKTMWIKNLHQSALGSYNWSNRSRWQLVGRDWKLAGSGQNFSIKVATTLDQYKAEGGLVAVLKKKLIQESCIRSYHL
ncbi:hypothetical protein T10_2313 [Trichinella papuae]|uniref:Uncharacterized protein n=1 Tax=Trichinella papuae TaxID=268474 RepID=A0A0V1MLF2_9BILA|nr:hypothetical protein T10_2313 [Trichinella papuae]